MCYGVFGKLCHHQRWMAQLHIRQRGNYYDELNSLKDLFELALRIGVKVKTIRMRGRFDKGVIVSGEGFYLRRNSRGFRSPCCQSKEEFFLKINGVYVFGDYVQIILLRLEELVLQLGEKGKVKKELADRKKRNRSIKKIILEKEEVTRTIINFLKK